VLTLRIGGIDAKALGYGHVGGLEVAHLWSTTGGGLQYIKFDLALPPRYSHPVITEGAVVEVMRGPVLLGTAHLSDVDREAWTFTADGLFRRAEQFNAEGTLSPLDVVTAANSRGLGWNGTGNLPATVVPTDGNTKPGTVAEVLNLYAKLNNQRWGLSADGTPYMSSDPTTVSWALRPGTPVMETADDDYVSRVVVRYVSGSVGTPPALTYAEVSATSTDTPHGQREAFEDITSLGLLTAPNATAYATAFLAANAARRGFTSGIEVAPGQLTNLGNVPIDGWAASLFVLGKLGIQHNVIDDKGRASHGQTLQWICGSTLWKSDDNSLTLTPVGLLPRTVAQAFADNSSLALRKSVGITTE
jgi:hypothetical protein